MDGVTWTTPSINLERVLPTLTIVKMSKKYVPTFRLAVLAADIEMKIVPLLFAVSVVHTNDADALGDTRDLLRLPLIV
jgi:hypothetical protein